MREYEYFDDKGNPVIVLGKPLEEYLEDEGSLRRYNFMLLLKVDRLEKEIDLLKKQIDSFKK